MVSCIYASKDLTYEFGHGVRMFLLSLLQGCLVDFLIWLLRLDYFLLGAGLNWCSGGCDVRHDCCRDGLRNEESRNNCVGIGGLAVHYNIK